MLKTKSFSILNLFHQRSSIKVQRALEFSSNDDEEVTVTQILERKQLTGSFVIVGKFKWSSLTEERVVQGHPKNIRKGKFVDKTGNTVDITVWRDQLINSLNGKENTPLRWYDLVINKKSKVQISTTHSTSFQEVCDADLEIVDFRWENLLCCPDILSTRLKKYLVCTYCRKWSSLDSNLPEIITCEKCKSKMKSSKCESAFLVNADIKGLEKELIFSPRIFENNSVREDKAEEWLLSFCRAKARYRIRRKICSCGCF